MSTSKGELTGVVYGFATTIIKVLEDLKPDYMAASFDLSGPTFRHKEYKEYKATRVKADQELYDQIPRVRELVATMGIPIYEKQGFEADDVIGTITKQISNIKSPKKEIPSTDYQLQATSYQIYIVSGDKDIFQLINGNVFVYNLKKGLSQTQIVDKDVIKKDYNLEPEDFIDLKALAGDASDNIPGVPGIGAKTATTLLQKFDTLDGIYQKLQETRDKIQTNQKLEIRNQNDISNIKDEEVEEVAKEMNLRPRIIRLLIEYKEQAYLSQKLATIHKDVPIDFSLEESEFGKYDKEKLRQFFEQLGFRSLLKRFGASSDIDTLNDKNQPMVDRSKLKKDKQLKLL